MISQPEIKQYLTEYARAKPNIVIARLDKGSIVEKDSGSAYEIDNLDIYKKLCDLPNGSIPYSQIAKLATSEYKLRQVFSKAEKRTDGKLILPFSEALKSGFCGPLEKAILVQLSAQRGEDAFLIDGVIIFDFGDKRFRSTYNVVFKGENPYLLDAQNPLLKDKSGNVTKYSAPITGIEWDAFQVPKELQRGRVYKLV